MPQKTKQPNPGPIYYKLFAFLWPQILFLKTQFFISTLTFFVLWNLICDGFEFGFSSWNQSLIVLGLHKVQSLPQALSLRFTHSLPFFNFLKLTTLYFPSLQKKILEKLLSITSFPLRTSVLFIWEKNSNLLPNICFL